VRGRQRLHRGGIVDHDCERSGFFPDERTRHRKRHETQNEDLGEEHPIQPRPSTETLAPKTAQRPERQHARDRHARRPLPGQICQHQRRDEGEKYERAWIKKSHRITLQCARPRSLTARTKKFWKSWSVV